MNKPKIFFASTLKPIDDIRMFYKLGLSLNSTNYELHFFGQTNNSLKQSPNNIHLHPLKKFSRKSLFRLLTPWILLLKLIKVKPHILVINSTELLQLIFLYRIILGVKILYDIQENHKKNILHQNVYPRFIKPLFASSIRIMETIASLFISHFILAETSYEKELKFIGNRFTTLQNKSLIKQLQKTHITNTKNPTFIFTGTIAIEFGIQEAIQLFENYSKENPLAQLHIIGKIPQLYTETLLKEYQIKNSRIKLFINKNPIDHKLIEDHIRTADFAFCTYQNNKSFEGKTPTKVFEYLGSQLPMITFSDLSFSSLILENNAGIILERQALKTTPLDISSNSSFYNTQATINPFWEEEKEIFKSIIDEILKQQDF